ncbi:MAG: hypothetical protein OEM21_09325 [Nitrosopumilus sp.]|nr:hypothetical protein [Nitrosopumilus sp.]
MEPRITFLKFALIIVFFILVLAIITHPVFSSRDDLRTRDGISIGHNDVIKIHNIDFLIVNTRDTDSIELRYSGISLNSSAVGTVGIYFPYKVKMITNDTDWEQREVESGTAFMKKYICEKNEDCFINFDEQPIFKLSPEHTKFDSKNLYQHGIKIKLDDVVPSKANDFFRENQIKNNYLKFTFDNSTKREVSIIIPRTADHIHPIPMAEPDIFHNPGQDYSNNRLFWNLYKNNHAFFLDYEMPDERSNYDFHQLLITMSGIFVGIIIGAMGISATISTKSDDINSHYKIYR